MSAPAPPAPGTDAHDQAVLGHVFKVLFEIDLATVHDHPILEAFIKEGIDCFSAVLMLSKSQIESMTYIDNSVAPPVERKLTVFHQNQIWGIIKFYHHLGSFTGTAPNLLSATKATFRLFLVQDYTSSSEVVPFPEGFRRRKAYAKTFTSKIRPNIKDYPIFKQEANFSHWQQQFLAVATAHSLKQVLEEGLPLDDDDRAQMDWMYACLQNCVQIASGQGIVRGHIVLKNTRECWKDITTFFKTATSSTLYTQEIASYIQSVRLSRGDWKGTLEGFIHHFEKQMNIYQELSPIAYEPMHYIQFLHNSLAGITGMDTVLTNYENNMITLGKDPKVLTFPQFKTMVLKVAQQKDRSNDWRPNNSKRTANVASILYSDGTYGEEIVFDDQDDDWQVNTHDIDTPISDIMVFNTNRAHNNTNGTTRGNPKKVYMDVEAYRKLSRDSKIAWNKISEDDKKVILQEASLADGPPPRGGNRNSNRSVNNHESQIRGQDLTANAHSQVPADEKIDSDEPPASGQLEVSVHELKSLKESTPDLIELATRKNNHDVSGQQIAMLLSQAKSNGTESRSVHFHESVSDPVSSRTQYSVNMHKMTPTDEKSEQEESEIANNAQAGLDFFQAAMRRRQTSANSTSISGSNATVPTSPDQQGSVRSVASTVAASPSPDFDPTNVRHIVQRHMSPAPTSTDTVAVPETTAAQSALDFYNKMFGSAQARPSATAQTNPSTSLIPPNAAMTTEHGTSNENAPQDSKPSAEEKGGEEEDPPSNDQNAALKDNSGHNDPDEETNVDNVVEQDGEIVNRAVTAEIVALESQGVIVPVNNDEAPALETKLPR
jgi:hypothetical protein